MLIPWPDDNNGSAGTLYSAAWALERLRALTVTISVDVGRAFLEELGHQITDLSDSSRQPIRS